MPQSDAPAGPILLERYAEPYAAIAWRLGRPYPADALAVLRQRLLPDAPPEALQMCEQIAQESLGAIAEQIDTTAPISPSTTDPAQPVKPLAPDPLCALVVFNPLGWPRTEEVGCIFSLPAGTVPESLIAVRGAQADAAPCSVTSEREPADPAAVRWSVRFPAAVPAFGYQTFFVTPEEPVKFPPTVLPADCRLEAEGEWEVVRARQEVENARAPLYVISTSLHAGSLPRSHTFFRTEPESLFLTTIRQSEDGQALLFTAIHRGNTPIKPGIQLSEILQIGEPVQVRSGDAPEVRNGDLLQPGQTVTWRLETGGKRA